MLCLQDSTKVQTLCAIGAPCHLKGMLHFLLQTYNRHECPLSHHILLAEWALDSSVLLTMTWTYEHIVISDVDVGAASVLCSPLSDLSIN